MTPERLQAWAQAAWAGLLSLPLAACPGDAPPPHPVQEVPCALDEAADFTQTCRLEAAGALWVLSRPDGGFVRLKRVPGGAVTVDGFPRVAARRHAARLELALGHDRYRLPW